MIRDWNVVIESVAGVPAHVSAFGFEPGGGVWVVVDPRKNFIDVRTFEPHAFDFWLATESGVGHSDTEVLRIEARRQTMVWFPGLWCVGVVKRLVGLRSGALSPAGLRRDLLRAGAQRVFTRESQNAPTDA